MGDSASKEEPVSDEEPEIPNVVEPVEPSTPPNIILNSEEALDDSQFNTGVSSVVQVEGIRKEILSKRANEPAESHAHYFDDKDFPADSTSLWFSPDPPHPKWREIQWKRIGELSKKPRLTKDGMSGDDIMQGMLGDCWWLSSCAAIARNQTQMAKIIPTEQSQSPEGSDYVGMFHFRFWRFGAWVDVVIDDRLPTIDGRPAFCKSGDGDEFWPALVEKAYAKLHGSYQAIAGGFATDGLEDLTGGMAVTFKLGDKTPPDAFKILLKSVKKGSFACCAIEGGAESVNRQTGLVNRHAYTITGAAKIPFRGSTVQLVRIRNPWGNQVEWTGDWSDKSSMWDDVTASDRQNLGYADEADGEWWMSFQDFAGHFSAVTICTLGPDFDNDGALTGDSWMLSMVRGKWEKGTAGGSRNNVEKFATNPQYYIELKEPDDFDPEKDDPEEEGKCSIVIGLMQEHRRKGKAEKLKNLFLALTLYKLNEKPSFRLEADYFRYNRKTAGTQYTNLREVTLTAELDPGHYVIIPTSFYPDESGSFLIRVFTEKAVEIAELRSPEV